MDDFEAAARQRSRGLEATLRLPWGFTAKHYPLTRSEEIKNARIKAATLLAKDPETFVAIARGRPVAVGRLDRKQLRLLETWVR